MRTNAVLEQLRSDGPQPICEVDGGVTARCYEEGLRKFRIPSCSSGSGIANGDTRPFFYIEGEHEAIDVVKAWLSYNEGRIPDGAEESVYRKIVRKGDDFRDAAQEVFNLSEMFAGRGSVNEGGGTCPLCGDGYSGRLPDHLPC